MKHSPIVTSVVGVCLFAVATISSWTTHATGHPGATHSVEIKLRGTIESIENERWVVAGREFVVTARTDIEDYVRPGDYVQVEADEDANGKWVAEEIDRKRKPWRAGRDVEIKLKGTIEAMDGNNWKVAGKSFEVTPRTTLEDSIYVGARVKVDAYEDDKGKWIAKEVDSKEENRRR